MGDLLIKICGLTNPGDAQTAIAAGADLLGFVFVPGTPRCVDPADADWVTGLARAETVGVFRGASLDEIMDIRAMLKLDRVQLHGDEPDGFLADLGPSTIRRVDPEDRDAWVRVAELGGRCLPLLDPGGGDGVSWGWGRLGRPPDGLRFGLAGGLTPETVAEAVTVLRPALVDVSSGVEQEKGIKDSDKIRAFIRNARAAQSNCD